MNMPNKKRISKLQIGMNELINNPKNIINNYFNNSNSNKKKINKNLVIKNNYSKTQNNFYPNNIIIPSFINNKNE